MLAPALPRVDILIGDVFTELLFLPSNHFDCIVTSPPYWGLRDYGVEGQLGLEPTLEEYLYNLTIVFREARRVLKPSGTMWPLVERCLLAGCPRFGSVLDPFGGAGTTGLVARRLGMSATLIELNPAYAALARARIDRG